MEGPARPDLAGLPPEVVAYIEWLEAQQGPTRAAQRPPRPETAESFDEPPTTLNVISISRAGVAKRTPRHLYSRQRRGGMGVFDLELAEGDTPAALAVADEAEAILVFTSGGRAYRLPVAALPDSPVRAKGVALAGLVHLPSHEMVVAALPASPGGRCENVVLLSQRGWVRRVRASFFGPSMIQGTIFHDMKEGGPLVAAAWTDGKHDVFIATRDGKGIRFAESQIPSRGCLGIRLDAVDSAVAVCGVSSDDGVFMLGHDGAGTTRLMSGFAANKAPGAGGKVAMKSDRLVGAVTVRDGDELLAISELGKIIRFAADEVPAKEGVVQGVACMTLRADEVSALVALDGSAAAPLV